MSNRMFSIYLLCTFFLGTAYFIPLTHLANKVDTSVPRLTEEEAAWLISSIGAGSFFGRAGHGWFVDKRYISAQTLMLISIIFALVETLTLVLTNIFTVLMVVCFLFGIHTGVVVPLTFVIPRLLVKPEQVPSVIGLTLLIHALGNAVGPVLGGWLYDITGDYLIAFIVASGIYGLAVVCLIPVCRFLWRQHRYGPITNTVSWRQPEPPPSTRNHVSQSTTITTV